jgi:hypothetical protein
MRCPVCKHDWPPGNEHGICVALFGACLWCRLGPHAPVTDEQREADLAAIRARRAAEGDATYIRVEDYRKVIDPHSHRVLAP